MLRRRGDAGPRLHVAHDVEAEPLGKIRVRTVVGHHLCSLVRREHRHPALLGFVKSDVEVAQPLLEDRAVTGTGCDERVRNRPRNGLAVLGVEPIVGVAKRVHVAHRARDLALGHIENARPERRIHVAFGTDLDPAVSALQDERRKPPGLQVAPHYDEHVGSQEAQDETGLRLHEVGILVTTSDGFHVDAFASDLTRNGRQILGGRHDTYPTLGPTWARQRQERRRRASWRFCVSSYCLLNTAAQTTSFRPPTRKDGHRAHQSRTGVETGTRWLLSDPRTAYAGTARAAGRTRSARR